MSAAPVELESRSCPLGCAPNDCFVLTGRDRLHDLPGEFRVVRCETCGLLRTDPRPTPAAMSFYYPENYAPYEGTRVEGKPSPRSSWKSALKRRAKRLLDQRIDSLPPAPRPPGRLLEIGCASGAFLHRMSGEGWEVAGIEFSESAARAARALGYPVLAGAVEEIPLPAASYDLIVGWMVLEHTHEPVAVLRKLRAAARPGARLVLSVPNAASREFAYFRQAWFALQLPHHLYHFTPETLARVLAAGGWRVERILQQRELSNLVASAGYLLRDRGRFPRLANRLIAFPWRRGKSYFALLPLAYLLGALGQTGRMTVWAQRDDER